MAKWTADEVGAKLQELFTDAGMDVKYDGLHLKIKDVTIDIECKNYSGEPMFIICNKRFYKTKDGDYNFGGMVSAIMAALPKRLEEERNRKVMIDRQVALRTRAEEEKWGDPQRGGYGYQVSSDAAVAVITNGFRLTVVVDSLEELDKALKKLGVK